MNDEVKIKEEISHQAMEYCIVQYGIEPPEESMKEFKAYTAGATEFYLKGKAETKAFKCPNCGETMTNIPASDAVLAAKKEEYNRAVGDAIKIIMDNLSVCEVLTVAKTGYIRTLTALQQLKESANETIRNT